jgi:hypothetical protein
MAFKYNITEFCTAIKPFCFSYFFSREEDMQAIYFDPDILVYSSLEEIWQLLDNKTAILTPHILTQEVDYTGVVPEQGILGNGIYNLGFVAFKKNAASVVLIHWWEKRLVSKSFIDKFDGLFTDQKWMEFLPVFLPPHELEIALHPGMNVAPWNYYERKIIREHEGFFAINRIMGGERKKLVFVHYSGFNYKKLTSNNTGNKNIPTLKIPEDITPLLTHYAEIISASTMKTYLNYTYTYNYFKNNEIIVGFYRRLFRRLAEDKRDFGNPFEADGKQSFYALLKRRKLLLKKDAQNVDSLNEQSLEGFEKKLYMLNKYHKLLKKIVGPKSYMLFSKFMIRYHRPENQVFLLLDEYMTSSYKNEYNNQP